MLQPHFHDHRDDETQAFDPQLEAGEANSGERR